MRSIDSSHFTRRSSSCHHATPSSPTSVVRTASCREGHAGMARPDIRAGTARDHFRRTRRGAGMAGLGADATAWSPRLFVAARKDPADCTIRTAVGIWLAAPMVAATFPDAATRSSLWDCFARADDPPAYSVAIEAAGLRDDPLTVNDAELNVRGHHSDPGTMSKSACPCLD